jgi:hypothetical protein
MKLPQTGGCQCGKIRYEITEAPQLVYTCHCTDCQRLTSSASPTAGGSTRGGFAPNVGLGFAARRGMAWFACVRARSTTRHGCDRPGISGPGASSPGSPSPRVIKFSRRSRPRSAPAQCRRPLEKIVLSRHCRRRSTAGGATCARRLARTASAGMESPTLTFAQ